MSLVVSQPAPDFALPDQDGTIHILSDYKGKWIFLYFYPEDDTPACTVEACSVRDNWDEFTKKGIQVFGVSGNDAESHTKFISKYSLPFTLLTDADNTIMRQYGAYGEKNMYGKIVVGVIRSSVLIDPEGNVAKFYTRVKTPTHITQVLRNLEELQK